ncbi:MAG TPA: DUF1614 domain-containing protein [Symbiobacteriaceae bacterium]|nr:DUF1614 domain-containing protein [Symbiobacteriaceae bacterium]
MPVGPIMLTILLVLIYFGLVERVLARMRLTERHALLLVGAMLLGSLLDIDLAPGLTINLGGGVIPLGVAAYLIITAGTWYESARAVTAAMITAAAVYLVGRWFPPGEPTELNLFFMDAQYLYGLTAGLVGYTAGRSRRSAFCAGVLGVALADVAHYVAFVMGGERTDLAVHVGGGGFWDTTMVAGVLAVLVAELIGESREALPGGTSAGGDRDFPD